MLDSDSVLGSHGYSLLGTVDMALVLCHPVQAKNDIKAIISQDNEVGIELPALDEWGCILAHESRSGYFARGLDQQG